MIGRVAVLAVLFAIPAVAAAETAADCTPQPDCRVLYVERRPGSTSGPLNPSAINPEPDGAGGRGLAPNALKRSDQLRMPSAPQF